MERPYTTFQHLHLPLFEHVLGRASICVENMSIRRGQDHEQSDSSPARHGELRRAIMPPAHCHKSSRPSASTAMTSRCLSPSKRSDYAPPKLACLLLALSVLITPISAVLVNFENCLSLDWQNQLPLYLQFVPLYVDAVFNTTDPSHNLNVTVYGNVTGSLPLVVLPPSTSAEWSNPNFTDGKIVDVPDPDGNNVATTLSNKVNVLTYEPYSEKLNFCDNLLDGSCPLGPVFDVANA